MRRSGSGLSRSRALTGSLLTQPRPPSSSSPLPHAGSSPISPSFRSAQSPRWLRPPLRAPGTRTAAGGIPAGDEGEAAAEPGAEGRPGVLRVPWLLAARRGRRWQRVGTVPLRRPNPPPSRHQGRTVREEPPPLPAAALAHVRRLGSEASLLLIKSYTLVITN